MIDGAVGKTCLLIVYVNNEFPETYVPTVFETYDAQIRYKNQLIKFSLWDTAGQEEYDKLRYLSYPNANVFLVCFSLTSKSSLNNVVHRWKVELDEHAKGVPIILVGTKADCRDDQQFLQKMKDDGLGEELVQDSDAEEVAKKIGAVCFMKTSARLKTGVQEVFNKCLDIRFERTVGKKKKCLLM